MSKAIYAFSGDPITYGHIDIIERASKIFQEVVVGIGVNPAKKYVFTLEERTRFAMDSLKHLNNITVKSFEGMLTDFAYEQNVPVIIRGLRNGEDFTYEMILHQVNENQKLNIDTVFLPTRSELSYISSGAVKAIQLEHGNVTDYVPPLVKQQLEWKISGQLLIGVTGEIGAGKSTFCKSFEQKFGMPVHHIDMDEIGKHILFDLDTPASQRIRQELNMLIGKNVDHEFDLITLQRNVFTDKNILMKFNELLRKPFEVQLRKRLYTLSGIILIESALFAEMDFTDIVNHTLILIGCTKDTQTARLKERGYDDEKIKFKNDIQYNNASKRKAIQNKITASGYGCLFELSEYKDDTLEMQSWFAGINVAHGRVLSKT